MPFIQTRVLAILVLALVFTLPSTPLSAQLSSVGDKNVSSPRPPVPCDNPEGPGAMFYDFKKLVIYYMDFTSLGQEKLPGYPEPLKYENFNKALIEQVRKNFVLCLNNPSGQAKPIVVARPLNRIVGGEYPALKALRQEAYDPNNLTIVLSVNYRMYVPKRPDVLDLGLARFQFYRPGHFGHDALPLVPNKSGSSILVPKRGADALQTSLIKFFRKIQPSNPVGWDRWPPSPHGPRTMK